MEKETKWKKSQSIQSTKWIEWEERGEWIMPITGKVVGGYLLSNT